MDKKELKFEDLQGDDGYIRLENLPENERKAILELTKDKVVALADYLPGGKLNKETVAENSGMFVVKFDQNKSLVGTRPSNYSGIDATEKDNVATMLKRNAAYIQESMDDYFGIDSSDKAKRIFVSPMTQLNGSVSACKVFYTGYDEDNHGEVSAMMSDNISSVIAKSIPMDWNSEPYSITVDELNMVKANYSNDIINVKSDDSKTADSPKDITLNEGLVSGSNVGVNKGIEI